MQKNDSILFKFLNDPKNSHAKEAILMHRLCLDLKVVAATTGYYLNTYWDDVDHDGFDLIFDDQYSIMKTQVKSVFKGAKTKKWDIHKRILRPVVGECEKFGFDLSPENLGVAGGVVLMEYRVNSEDLLEVDYYYTDFYILLAFKHKLFQRVKSNSCTAIETCLSELYKGKSSEKLAVPRSAFIKARSPANLLALLGLHSTHGHSWKYDVDRLVSEPTCAPSSTIAKQREEERKKFWEELKNMICEDSIKGFFQPPKE